MFLFLVQQLIFVYHLRVSTMGHAIMMPMTSDARVVLVGQDQHVRYVSNVIDIFFALLSHYKR